MPILAAEPSIYPETLLDDAVLDESRSWYALYTKPRQEKGLARDLLRVEIPFYLPLVASPHIYRGRQIVSHLPLFSGYLFLFGTPEERQQACLTDRIVHLLAVDDGEELASDLLQVHRLIESNAPLTVEARLGPGRRVRIRHGCMAGMEGKVLSRCRRTRLVVEVRFLQQGISVEVDDCMLEPIDC